MCFLPLVSDNPALNMIWWAQVLFMHDLRESYSMKWKFMYFLQLVPGNPAHWHGLWVQVLLRMIYGNHTLWNGNLCTFSPWSLRIPLYDMVSTCTFYAWSLGIIPFECKLMYVLPLVSENPALWHGEYMYFLYMIFGNNTLWNGNLCTFSHWSLGILLYDMVSTCTFRLHVPRESCSIRCWVHVLFVSVVPWNPALWHGEESRTCLLYDMVRSRGHVQYFNFLHFDTGVSFSLARSCTLSSMIPGIPSLWS